MTATPVPTEAEMAPATPDPRQARREALVVAALAVLAAVPRFWAFGREGLTHFDEGVYALAGLWSVSPGGLAALDPGLVPYAPPGFPVLIGLAYAVLGVTDSAALLVTAVCGVLTIPTAAWVARRTFGPGAGAAAGAFAALSVAHVAFSRKALTDSPFLLAWLAAVGLGGRFLERPSLWRAACLGLAVGLAQNVKYNGWVAGAAVAFAAVAGLVADRDARRPRAALATFGFGLLAALTAGLVYIPWFRFVEAHGGYADLVRHHRSYVGTASAWLPHWRHQLAQAVALSGGMAVGALAWTLAWVGAGLSARGLPWFFPRSYWDGARLRLGWMLGAAVLATIPELPWWVGLAWSGWLLVNASPARRLLGGWWVVLSVMTPWYHPYARLWLPLHAAGWVMLAGVVVSLGPFPGSALEVPGAAIFRDRRLLAQGAVTLLCLVLARVHWGANRPRPWDARDVFAPTDGLRTVVAELVTNSPFAPAPDPRLFVLARRPLVFYLALRGRAPLLVPDVAALTRGPSGDRDWALVDGGQIGEATTDGAPWKTVEAAWVRASVWRRHLDPVVRLDVNPDAPYEAYDPDPIMILLLTPKGAPRPAVRAGSFSGFDP